MVYWGRELFCKMILLNRFTSYLQDALYSLAKFKVASEPSKSENSIGSVWKAQTKKEKKTI